MNKFAFFVVLFVFIFWTMILSAATQSNPISPPSQPNQSTHHSQGYSKADDFQDKKIGILVGSVYEEILKKRYPNAKSIFLDSRPNQILSLERGQCDAIMYSDDGIPTVLAAHPLLGKIDDPIMTEDLGFAFPKSNFRLREKFNAFLNELRKTGELKEIYDGWVNRFDAMPTPKLTGDGSGGTLRFGTTGTDVPISTMRGTDLVGYDIDILYRFANREKMEIEVFKTHFGGLLAALGAGKIDIAGSGIMITEERKKVAAFSVPYAKKSVFFLTLKSKISGNNNEEDGHHIKLTFLQSMAESFHNNLIAEKRYLLIIQGLKTTIVLSVFSTIFGTILGGLICFLAMSKNTVFKKTAEIYITIVRGIPILVLLMLMFYVILSQAPLSAITVAVLAFGINFAAYASNIFKSAIESIPQGQYEAGIAMGFTKTGTFCNIILPQAVKRIFPVYAGQMITLIKETSIVGYIAVEDLTKVSDIIRSRTFDAFFPLILIAVIYFTLAWLATLLLDFCAKKGGLK